MVRIVFVGGPMDGQEIRGEWAELVRSMTDEEGRFTLTSEQDVSYQHRLEGERAVFEMSVSWLGVTDN